MTTFMPVLFALSISALVFTLSVPPKAKRRLQQLTSSRGQVGVARRTVSAAKAPQPQEEIDQTLILDLLAAALTAGSPIPQALESVGRASGGEIGKTMLTTAAYLHLGASWEAAWAEAEDVAREKQRKEIRELASTLQPAWTRGAAVKPLLKHTQRRIRREQAARNRVAARRLGVKLVLPVAACYLPAFVVLGLVPVVIVLITQGVSLL